MTTASPKATPSSKSRAASKQRKKRPARGYFAAAKFFVVALITQINKHEIFSLAAALAFYTTLSMSPLLIISLWTVGKLGFQDQEVLVQQVVALVGPEAGATIASMIEDARTTPSLSSMAGIFGFAALIVSAGTVFGQLQMSLNLIFNIKPPLKTQWLNWLRKRLLSAGMVLSLGFIAVVSLILSAVMAFIASHLYLPSWAAQSYPIISEALISFCIFTLFFTALFKILPDTPLSWRQMLTGGAVTALLFSVGKSFIGLYLGQSSVASAFGAAGSLVILLIWVYYSSVILFIGAEITEILSRGTNTVQQSAVVSELEKAGSKGQATR